MIGEHVWVCRYVSFCPITVSLLSAQLSFMRWEFPNDVLRVSQLQTEWTLSGSSRRCRIGLSSFCCPTNPNGPGGDPGTLERLHFSPSSGEPRGSSTRRLKILLHICWTDITEAKKKPAPMFLKTQHHRWPAKQKAAFERSFMAQRNVKKWFPFAFGAP